MIQFGNQFIQRIAFELRHVFSGYHLFLNQEKNCTRQAILVERSTSSIPKIAPAFDEPLGLPHPVPNFVNFVRGRK
jgi:hypothetical protein